MFMGYICTNHYAEKSRYTAIRQAFVVWYSNFRNNMASVSLVVWKCVAQDAEILFRFISRE